MIDIKTLAGKVDQLDYKVRKDLGDFQIKFDQLKTKLDDYPSRNTTEQIPAVWSFGAGLKAGKVITNEVEDSVVCTDANKQLVATNRLKFLSATTSNNLALTGAAALLTFDSTPFVDDIYEPVRTPSASPLTSAQFTNIRIKEDGLYQVTFSLPVVGTAVAGSTDVYVSASVSRASYGAARKDQVGLMGQVNLYSTGAFATYAQITKTSIVELLANDLLGVGGYKVAGAAAVTIGGGQTGLTILKIR